MPRIRSEISGRISTSEFQQHTPRSARFWHFPRLSVPLPNHCNYGIVNPGRIYDRHDAERRTAAHGRNNCKHQVWHPNSPAAQNCPPGMMPDMCTDRNSADRSLQTSAVTVPTALSAGRSLGSLSGRLLRALLRFFLSGTLILLCVLPHAAIWTEYRIIRNFPITVNAVFHPYPSLSISDLRAKNSCPAKLCLSYHRMTVKAMIN